MDVFPDFGGVGGAADLRSIVGALLMFVLVTAVLMLCLLYTSPSPRDATLSRMPSSA